MSMPQRPLLPTSSGMENKSPRLGGGPSGTNGYPFPFCATSSPSSVFPSMPIFPHGFQQVYNSMVQASLMQMAQHQQQQNQNQLHQNQMQHHQRNNSAGASPANSDQASSRSESPQGKKLILDEDGCATCPACGDKLPENEWLAHVELEKQRLIHHITGVKERVLCQSFSGSFEQSNKREVELQRIKNNQQKRQILKRGSASIIRDCLTPFSRQSNDETGSSESPDTKKDEDISVMKCSSCMQPCSYGIVMTSFDRPKCQMCFDIIRTQSCILTAHTPPSAHHDEENSPVCKKMKLESEE